MHPPKQIYCRPLLIATKNIHMLRYLTEKGAKIDCYFDNKSKTLLYYAAENNNYNVCEFLLEKGVSFITFKKSNKTPLHIAVEKNNKDICSLFINYGADFTKTNDDEETPLYLAIKLDYLDLCDVLLKKNIYTYEYGSIKKSLKIAVQKKNVNLCRRLLEKKANVDDAEGCMDSNPESYRNPIHEMITIYEGAEDDELFLLLLKNSTRLEKISPISKDYSGTYLHFLIEHKKMNIIPSDNIMEFLFRSIEIKDSRGHEPMLCALINLEEYVYRKEEKMASLILEIIDKMIPKVKINEQIKKYAEKVDSTFWLTPSMWDNKKIHTLMEKN